jgi:putative ATP-dependent endonuclease of OLD family
MGTAAVYVASIAAATNGFGHFNNSSVPMARIRKVVIENFRCIKRLTWLPAPGVNCLIGPGDSGKSTVLDAIDYCLGARRNLQFNDADFHQLNVEEPIRISVTFGELGDSLKNLDAYGMYLRGFDSSSGEVEDEPRDDAETVLTLQLTVASDLEPSWSLVSERAQAQGQSRNLNWSDRVSLAPMRIGATAGYHLGWGRGSVLNRLSEERADASAALAKAARDARAAFGEDAQEQLNETLGIVGQTAEELGIPLNGDVKAMLDAHSVSFSGGTIALHDEDGVPLRGLGVGSTRLLIAGLQRKAADDASIIIVDETEHGLEPHRIIRFLGSLGAKEKSSPLQSFMTTHSPVVLRELSGDQLFVVRKGEEDHNLTQIGTADDIQSTIRLYPDAFLAQSVLVCEGASEVGCVRGIDLHRVESGQTSIAASGVALVDCGGGDAERCFKRAGVFQKLGYRTAILRDSDKEVPEETSEAFTEAGGTIIAWRNGRALEDELFLSLTDDGIDELLDRAIELHGKELVAEHVRTAAGDGTDLAKVRAKAKTDGYSRKIRAVLGKAARFRKAGWFKSVSWMEAVAHDIVGPDLPDADKEFRAIIKSIFAWADEDA